MKKEGDNSFGIASVVLGLVGLVSGVFVLPMILSITGLVFGIIQYKRGKNAWAIWGIILSVLGISVSIMVLWSIISALTQMQQLIAACQVNPAMQGCTELLKLAGAQ